MIPIYLIVGFHFGELDILFYQGIRFFTYKALKTTELLVLHKKNFRQIFYSDFKQVGQEFSKNAYSRYKKTKRIMKEAKTFCEQNVLNIHPEYTDKKIQSRIKKRTLMNLTNIVSRAQIFLIFFFLAKFWKFQEF